MIVWIPSGSFWVGNSRGIKMKPCVLSPVLGAHILP